MKNLSEALKKSMIDKLEKHERVLTKFTKSDLENGDLLYESTDKNFWMYLDGEEMLKHAKEMKNMTVQNYKDLHNNSAFIVYADANDYYSKHFGFYRIPKQDLRSQNNHITGVGKIFDTLVKCGDKYLQDNLTIEEIFTENDNFKIYLS